MNKDNNVQSGNQTAIEDLNLNESTAESIKGGPADYLLELDGVKGETLDSRTHRQ